MARGTMRFGGTLAWALLGGWQYFQTSRPEVCGAAAGLLVFSAILYAKMLAIPLVVSYHTHIPEYIPKYTWKGLVEPMWKLIRFCTLMADVTLVPSRAMKVAVDPSHCAISS